MKSLRKAFEAAGALGGIILFAMALLVTTDVFYRFLTNRTITGVYEMCEIGFLMTTFCTLGVTQIRNKAIRIDIVQTKIKKGRFYYVLEVFNVLVSMFFFFVVTYIGFGEVAKAAQKGLTRGGIINIPLTIPYTFMVVGSIIMLVSLLCTLYISVQGIIKPERAVELHNKMFELIPPDEEKEKEA